MPELEHKSYKNKDGVHARDETIRTWSDKEVKEIHRAKGYDWRSNRTKLRVISVTNDFRDNYDDIFRRKTR